MMAYERSERAWNNFGKFIHQFQPETKTLIKKLERILIKLYRQNVSLLFNQTCLSERQRPNTHIYIWGSLNKFPDFFVWALLLIVHTWNSSPLWTNLLRLQCTCCTVPTTSGRPHGSPLVWARQWPSSQPLSFPQLSHNDSIWA